MDAIGAQELQFPALLPREPYEATGRWTEYGDGIFRLKDRKDADYLLGPTHEEMFTLVGEGPVLLLQGPAGLALPDPDQVPRRGAAARRPAARARVHHEGLLLLRHHRRGPRRVLRGAPRRPTSRPSTGSASTTSSSRRPAGRWAARSPRSSSPRPTSARTPTCAAPAATTPRTSRRSRSAPPAARAVRRRPGGARRGHPGHARPSTRWWSSSTPSTPATTGPGTAGDTLKNVLVVLKHPDGSREPLAIGLPGDREVDQKRLEGQLEPIEVEPMDDAELAQAPGAGQGLHRPGGAGGGVRVGHPLPRRPPCRRGHPLGHRRRRRRQPRPRPRRRPRLHARRHHRGRRGARRRPLPEL